MVAAPGTKRRSLLLLSVSNITMTHANIVKLGLIVKVNSTDDYNAIRRTIVSY